MGSFGDVVDLKHYAGLGTDGFDRQHLSGHRNRSFVGRDNAMVGDIRLVDVNVS